MTVQTHKVATDALETLGTHPIPDNSGRDAIHLAVEPVVAGEVLYPGQRIGLAYGKAFVAVAGIISARHCRSVPDFSRRDRPALLAGRPAAHHHVAATRLEPSCFRG